MKKFYLLLGLTTFSALANSFNAIQWQKLNLEESIQRKYSNSLATGFAPKQYLVNVEVEVNESGGPNFDSNSEKGSKVSDMKLQDSRGDYIAFSKIGLEVPIVEKFLDEDRTKLMNMYRFNEAYDIFKMIKDVKIMVYLDERLNEEQIKIAETLVSSTKISLGTIKPKVSFEKKFLHWVAPEVKKDKVDDKDGKNPKETRDPSILERDWYEWASRWGNGVGLILASLILSVVAFMLFKKWKEMMEQLKTATEAAKPNSDDKDDDKNGTSISAAASEEEKMEMKLRSQQGFERFKNCLDSYPIEAGQLVRVWLSTQEEQQISALKALTQQMDESDINKLFNLLNSDLKEKWKSIPATNLDDNQLMVANIFIGQEVFNALLVPSAVTDNDLLNLLVEMSPMNLKTFLEENKNFTGIIVNLLAPGTFNRLLELMNSDEISEIVSAGISFEVQKIAEESEALKAAMLEFKEKIAVSPFAKKLVQLITQATPDQETILFRSYALNSSGDSLTELAMLHFPAELIWSLPQSFLKETLQVYPSMKRAETLFIQEEDKKRELMTCFAAEGTPAFEMLRLDLENIQTDEGKKTALLSKKKDIWKEFVQFTRMNLKRHPELQDEKGKLISEWMKQFANKKQTLQVA